MREKTRKLLFHPLISGSSVVFAGAFISNIFNYIFNLALGRMLTVSDYGLYFALTSIINIFSIFNGSFQNIFAKFSAKYTSIGNKNLLSSLIYKGFIFIICFNIVIFAILIFMGGFFSSFLNIQDQKLYLISLLIIIVTIFNSMPTGILQGEMKFYFLSFVGALVPLLKIILGIFLILAGLKVFGVMFALLISFLIPYIISMIYMSNSFHKHERNSFTWQLFIKEFRGYSIKYLMASLGIVIISSTDIIFVRHFFSPQISGQYAALSLMGKAIFYFTSPINFVFFPLIAQKKEKKEKLFGTLFLAGLIIILFSAFLSFVYFLFPRFILMIFFPSKEYAVLAPYLGPYSLYILVFSLATLFCNFFLSVGNTGVYKINLIVSLVFIILILIFHDSLYQIIGILFFVSFLLLASFLIYYRYNASN